MSLSNKTILILEDEAIIAFGLEDMLSEEGAQVITTATVEQALAALDDGAPDYAILDVNLHGTKSYPVAEKLRGLSVPFVFATGYGDAEHPGEFASCPTVTKPYSLAQIRAGLDYGD